VGQVKNLATLNASPEDWVVTSAFILEFARLQQEVGALKLQVKLLQAKLDEKHPD